MSKHALLMLACCLVPLALLGAVYFARVDLGGFLPFAIILLCPLLHILMMRGMGHGHASHHEETRDQVSATPSCHDNGRPAPVEPTANRR